MDIEVLNKLVEIRQERREGVYVTTIDWPINNVSYERFITNIIFLIDRQHSKLLSA